MAGDNQKKSQHHAHHHHHHAHKKMVHLKSIERITHLPVVESVHAYYEKIKNYNTLIKWSLMPAETGMWLAVGTAMPVINYFQHPVSAVDSIVCHGLDVIEANLPVIKYPPEVVYNMTKDYVTSKVVAPVLKRADSVKQLSLNSANLCGEMAANRLNNAIDVADKYVEKYLPDITDATDSGADLSPEVLTNSDSKTVKTIQHVNQFGRKLQRRLTRRTIAEAKALKQQGRETIRYLVYLVDLLARDPKAFMEKAKDMWKELSKDEPENQVPPANLEQLIAMLTREMARRVVHLTNYTGTKMVLLSQHSLNAAHVGALNVVWWADYFIKVMHMELVLEITATQITRLHHFSLELLEKVVKLVSDLKQESLKFSSKPPALSSSKSSPQHTPPQPVQSPQYTPFSSPIHTTSPSPNSVFNAKTFPQQNGEPSVASESNHEESGTP